MQRLDHLHPPAEPASKQRLMRRLIRVIATILYETHVIIRIAGPRDARENDASGADARW
jgi:hypothetical protein